MLASPPKISIVTPCYNQVRFLEATIKSVLSQSYPNLEYIIIDGGSDDGTIEIIKKYSDSLTYWVSEPDRGHAHALNKGFSRATGDIMAWINGDDVYTPWCFYTVARVFDQFPEAEWLVGFNSWFNSEGSMVEAMRVNRNIYDYLLGRYRWIQQESVFWRRDLWSSTGGYINEEYSLMVDGELWTRFFLQAELYSVNCILAGFRQHQANRSHTFMDECIAEMNRCIAEMKQGCSTGILETSAALQHLHDLAKLPFIGSIALRLAAKYYRKHLAASSYKDIYWSGSTWELRQFPFSP